MNHYFNTLTWIAGIAISTSSIFAETKGVELVPVSIRELPSVGEFNAEYSNIVGGKDIRTFDTPNPLLKTFVSFQLENTENKISISQLQMQLSPPNDQTATDSMTRPITPSAVYGEGLQESFDGDFSNLAIFVEDSPHRIAVHMVEAATLGTWIQAVTVKGKSFVIVSPAYRAETGRIQLLSDAPFVGQLALITKRP